MKRPLIILAGPTAVGKTSTSIELAKRVNGEIISVDSMQVYKYMDIGTAKIKAHDMNGVKHYLIDILEPDEEFSVAVFKELAMEAIENIYAKGKIPILVGGTGFYIQALLYDVQFTNSNSHRFRAELEEIVNTDGPLVLHEKLREVDFESAESIHANNVKRVMRAYEYYLETGLKFSEHNEEQKMRKSIYNACYFVLNDLRELLYDRINDRIDLMIEEGLVKEVTNLLKKGYHRKMTSMEGLGYKEIIAYLEDEITLDEAIYLLKRDTRRFAKRQLTWFRREEDVIWLNKNDLNYDQEMILENMISIAKEQGVI